MAKRIWTIGDVSGNQVLTDDDHLYATHIGELRTALTGINVVTVARDGTGDYNCDGTDDHVQIQEAIDSLTSGGAVVIKPGTYVTSTSISIAHSNITLMGYGKATIIKRVDTDSTNYNMININTASIKDSTPLQNIEVCSLVIDGNYGVVTSVGGEGITMMRVDYSSFHHLTFLNSVSTCFFMGMSQHNSITNNYFGHCHAGYHVRYYSIGNDMGDMDRACDWNTLSDNIMETTDEYSSVSTNDVNHCVFNNNLISGAGEYGIELAQGVPGTSPACHDNIVSNNTVYNSATHGPSTGLIMYGDRNIITNNVVDTVQGYGIRTIVTTIGAASTDDTLIANNIVRNCDYSGIYIYNPLRAIVSNNRVENCGYHGIEMYDGSYCLITGNLFYNNGQSANATFDDVLLRGASLHNQVTANKSLANGTNKTFTCCRDVDTSDYNYISENTGVGNTSAVAANTGANTVLSNNRIL